MPYESMLANPSHATKRIAAEVAELMGNGSGPKHGSNDFAKRRWLRVTLAKALVSPPDSLGSDDPLGPTKRTAEWDPIGDSTVNLIRADFFMCLYGAYVPEVLPAKNMLSEYLTLYIQTESFARARMQTRLNAVSSVIFADATIDALVQSILKSDTKEGLSERINQAGENSLKLYDAFERLEELTNEDKDPLTKAPLALTAERVELLSVLDKTRVGPVFDCLGRLEVIKNELLEESLPSSDESSTIAFTDDISKCDVGYLKTRSRSEIANEIAEGTLEYIEGEDSGGEGLGPVVIAIDVSGSMEKKMGNGLEGDRIDGAMALSLSLMEQCQTQKREVVVMAFNRHTRTVLRSREDGMCKLSDIKSLLEISAHGSTSFLSCMDAVWEELEIGSISKDADVIWFTDGAGSFNECRTGVEWSSILNHRDRFKSLGVEHYVMNFGPSGESLKLICGAEDESGNPNEGCKRLHENIEKSFDSGMKSVMGQIKSKGENNKWL